MEAFLWLHHKLIWAQKDNFTLLMAQNCSNGLSQMYVGARQLQIFKKVKWQHWGDIILNQTYHPYVVFFRKNKADLYLVGTLACDKWNYKPLFNGAVVQLCNSISLSTSFTLCVQLWVLMSSVWVEVCGVAPLNRCCVWELQTPVDQSGRISSRPLNLSVLHLREPEGNVPYCI